MPSISEIADIHESAAQLIPWLVNGTLAEPDAARLHEHLAACAQCRADFEAERRLFAMIRDDGPLVFPGEAGFQRLMACIEADEFASAHPAAADGERPPPSAEQSADGAWPTAGSGQSPPSGSSLAAGAEERVQDEERVTAGGGRRTAAPERGRGAARRRSAARPRWRSRATVRWLTAAVVLETLSLGLGAWTWRADRAGDAAQVLAAAHSSDSAAARYRTLTSPAPRFGAGARVRVVFRPDLSLGQLRELLRGIDAHIVDGPTDARVYTLGFAEPIRSERELDARIAALRADPNVQFAEPAGSPH